MFVSVVNSDVMPLKGMIVGNNKTKNGRVTFNWNLHGLPTRCPRGQSPAEYWSNTLRPFNVRFGGCVWW